jgi:hypothetical protein
VARDREIALRIRLVPDTEAVIGKTGVHFLRGREAFFLDARGVKKLVDVYAVIGEHGLERAVSRLLSGETSEATPD